MKVKKKKKTYPGSVYGDWLATSKKSCRIKNLLAYLWFTVIAFPRTLDKIQHSHMIRNSKVTGEDPFARRANQISILEMVGVSCVNRTVSLG